MTIILLFLSLLTLLCAWVVYFLKKRVPNWGVILVPGIIAGGIIIYSFFSLSMPLDTRLVEYPAITLRHYPLWSEEISPTQNSIDNYCVHHHEYYAMMYVSQAPAEEGKIEEKEIPESTYYYYRKIWMQSRDRESDTLQNSREFTRWRWDDDAYNSLCYTKTEPYQNYFKNILPLYNLGHVTHKEAKALDLFDYAPLTMINSEGILEPRQTLIYGLDHLPDSVSRRASYISSLDHRFRPILLVWVGKGNKDELIKKQRSYWEGGKDNEAIFCISLTDTVSKEILWSGSFSWAETKDFEEYVLNSALEPGQRLDMHRYLKSVRNGFDSGLWCPRDFSTYSIAGMSSNYFVYVFCASILLLADIILFISIIRNPGKGEFHNHVSFLRHKKDV